MLKDTCPNYRLAQRLGRRDVLRAGSLSLLGLSLPELLARTPVMFAPYKMGSKLTRYIDPLRYYHCLNSGMEVVSTDIPQAHMLAERFRCTKAVGVLKTHDDRREHYIVPLRAAHLEIEGSAAAHELGKAYKYSSMNEVANRGSDSAQFIIVELK